jgi:hypothetical protein
MPDPILRPSDAENLAGVETGRAHLSHSRIGVFLACHRKYELQYEERLEPVSRPAALSMGSAFQKAIEFQDPEVGPLALDGWGFSPVTEVWEGVERHGYEHFEPAEPPYFHTQEAEDKHRINQAIVRAAAALYLRRWPSPVGEAREFEYKVRLRSPWTGRYSQTFDLQGFADGLIDRKPVVEPAGIPIYTDDDVPPGTVHILPDSKPPLELVENKLVGRIDQITVQRLPLDRQLQLARYGIWRATGRPVNKVHYRWVKKPSIKQRQGETVDEFTDRLAADYEAREDFYSYEPPPSYITAADLLRIEAEVWTWAEQLRALRRQRIYDRNTASCSDYGGCVYVPICSGDPDAEHLYRRREAL